MTRSSTRFAVPLLAAAAYSAKGRFWMAHWGATEEEVAMRLPSDHLVPADLMTTRAITVCRSAADVWPWIVQLGQGRGGFYSYDALENLARCDIHSADRIVPDWQTLVVGSEVKLAPAMALTVAVVEPDSTLVLRGDIPMGSGPAAFDFTWAFVLTDHGDGTSRLVVRERYQYLHWWAAAVVEPTSLISFVMTRKMLLGIAHRAEWSGNRPAAVPVMGAAAHSS